MKLPVKLAFLLVSVLYIACGSSAPKYEKTPVDNIIRDLSNVKPLSIILYDMDADGSTYKHKYKIIKDVNGTPKEEITPWHEVSERYFASQQDNMGMVIASKDSLGALSKVATPPGYDNYVGNSRYGSWQPQSNGTSFWQFYGQYAFMRDMFGMASYGPIYRSHYTEYRTYHSTGRPYYGSRTGGSYTYGTRSAGTSRAYSNSTWTKKPASFREGVRSRVQRSSTDGSRTSRSSSRYSGSSGSSNSSSSSRSRGGGFGK